MSTDFSRLLAAPLIAIASRGKMYHIQCVRLRPLTIRERLLEIVHQATAFPTAPYGDAITGATRLRREYADLLVKK